MLIEFFGENFGCFRDEFRLSMLAANKIDPKSDRGIVEVEVEGDDEPLRLLRAAAIYGPNGSGKSTVLRAAHALERLIKSSADLNSDDLLSHHEPFALKSGDSPVKFGLIVVIEKKVYAYSIVFTNTRFIAESLDQILADGTHIPLVDRHEQLVKGQWIQERQFELLARNFRPNALLLSLADRLAPSLAQSIAVGIRRSLATNWSLYYDAGFPQTPPVVTRVLHDRQYKNWLLSRLRDADTGIIDMKVKTYPPPKAGGNILAMGNNSHEPHRELHLIHSGQESPFAIPYNRESMGTHRFIDLSPIFYDLMHDRTPKTVFEDELDASLHPILLRELMQHFNCDIPGSQVYGQLVFAAHETSILDAEAKNAVLRRDQLYLTEKNAAGEAHLYSLADFQQKPRAVHNLRKRYLQGRYGALPSLGSFTE